MPRADRQVTNREEILKIMDGCDALTLALMDGEYPYTIPMNFGWEDQSGQLVLYMHGAKDGKKLELIRQNPNAAFSMSRNHRCILGKVACASLFQYESVCGRGKIEILEDDERMHALTVLMRQYDRTQEHVFTQKHAAAVSVLKLTVEEFTGKRREQK